MAAFASAAIRRAASNFLLLEQVRVQAVSSELFKRALSDDGRFTELTARVRTMGRGMMVFVTRMGVLFTLDGGLAGVTGGRVAVIT